MQPSQACVYLVGAGPGDPDLLTVKALRLIQTADVVVYDRLVSDAILKLIPEGVARIYVGKASGNHSLPQDEINDLLVKLARGNRQVVRLKGGDPFLYGRGSEEAQVLQQQQIPFEVVPGITSASACSSYAGIPLTHRGIARRVQFITGHCKADQPLMLDWQGMADPESTLAVYMGLANAAQISQALLAAGRAADTPVAVIQNGATAAQQVYISTLEHLVSMIEDNSIRSPAMMIIGEVVNLSHTLRWFQAGVEEPERYLGGQS